MTINGFQAVVLGLIQGLTEFLPVSSSGHLVIAQSLLGIESHVILFDVFVHVGTLVAVMAVFWQDIWQLLRRPFCKLTACLIIACIPAAIMCFCLNDLFKALFSSVIAVAIALIITGILLYFSDRLNGKRTLAEMNYLDALLIGIFQGVAIIPGLSRSGSTIFGALTRGLKRSEAARFSFLISIPVIFGALLKELLDASGEGSLVVTWTYFVGAAVAALVGYLAIRAFLRILEKKTLRYFSYYCWALAFVVIVANVLI